MSARSRQAPACRPVRSWPARDSERISQREDKTIHPKAHAREPALRGCDAKPFHARAINGDPEPGPSGICNAAIGMFNRLRHHSLPERMLRPVEFQQRLARAIAHRRMRQHSYQIDATRQARCRCPRHAARTARQMPPPYPRFSCIRKARPPRRYRAARYPSPPARIPRESPSACIRIRRPLPESAAAPHFDIRPEIIRAPQAPRTSRCHISQHHCRAQSPPAHQSRGSHPASAPVFGPIVSRTAAISPRSSSTPKPILSFTAPNPSRTYPALPL